MERELPVGKGTAGWTEVLPIFDPFAKSPASTETLCVKIGMSTTSLKPGFLTGTASETCCLANLIPPKPKLAGFCWWFSFFIGHVVGGRVCVCVCVWGCQIWMRLNEQNRNAEQQVCICVYVNAACIQLFRLKGHKRGTTRSRQTMVLSLAVPGAQTINCVS